MHVFEWWEEAGTLAENLSRNQENMQIPHSQGPGMEPTVQNTMDEHRLQSPPLVSAVPAERH